MPRFSRGFAMLLLLCFMFIHCCASFTTLMAGRISMHLQASSDGENGESSDDSSIPQLPAIGESSFDTKEPLSGNANKQQQSLDNDGEKKPVAFVSDKFELQYTCKICDTRNTFRVSRLAYRNGVVITVCKGCDSQHLIADNLGWTDYDGGFEGDTNTIEDFFTARGQADSVNRVSGDVFELEKLLDMPSGSIIDPDGNPAME